MSKAKATFSVVPKSERKPLNIGISDSPERFARLTRHLKTGQGQPLESKLFLLQAERESEQ